MTHGLEKGGSTPSLPPPPPPRPQLPGEVPTPGALACRGWGFVHLARSWPLPLHLEKKKLVQSPLYPHPKRMLTLFIDTCYRTVGQTLPKGAVTMGSRLGEERLNLTPTRRNGN